MRYFNVIVTLLLLLSLIMNFTLSSKLGQVENQLLNVSNNQQQILISVNGQEQHIRSVMDDIQKQQSWISEITMNVNSRDSQKDKIMAQVNWQIKEQSSDSKVMFHYTLGGQDTFTSIAVENQPKGIYQIEVPLTIHLEPRWEIFTSEQDSEITTSEMDEKRKEEAGYQTLKYYVSINHDDAVKSSEISTSYLGDIGIGTFGIISVNLDILKDKSSVIVTTYKTGQIENIQLLTYKNESFIDEQKMKPEFDHYIIEKMDMKSAKKLVIKVTYKDGETFEKVIYKR